MWGFSNTGVARWHDLEEIDASGILPLARKFGLNHGFTYAIDKKSSKSISSFTREDRDFSDQEIVEITNIVIAMHDYTADLDNFSPQELRQLRDISVIFTQSSE